MNLPFTNAQLIVAVFVLIVAVLIAVGAYLEHRKSKTRALRNRFGTEYDRAVVTHGSSRQAENKLADRETRVEALKDG